MRCALRPIGDRVTSFKSLRLSLARGPAKVSVVGSGSRCHGGARACTSSSKSSTKHEEVHSTRPNSDKLDQYLHRMVLNSNKHDNTSLHDLYHQYQNEAGAVIPRTVPYDERPHPSRRAELQHQSAMGKEDHQGDGMVLVVHVHIDPSRASLVKTVVCSGFVVDASIGLSQQGDTVITCAHTLNEMRSHLKQMESEGKDTQNCFSLIVPSSGPPRLVTRLLSSMPRSDVIVLEARSPIPAPRLRPLPLTPFPVYTGTSVLTHLFGSPDPPAVQHSIARTTETHRKPELGGVDKPISWLEGHAWRRWGCGLMLGYRSYTGLELEAGISSVLPHILTSVLPTSGSSGGPLVNGETGCVVGMISGRRMDNRVEGERGWGCSSEGIFEMFSLPGFMPSQQ